MFKIKILLVLCTFGLFGAFFTSDVRAGGSVVMGQLYVKMPDGSRHYLTGIGVEWKITSEAKGSCWYMGSTNGGENGNHRGTKTGDRWSNFGNSNGLPVPEIKDIDCTGQFTSSDPQCPYNGARQPINPSNGQVAFFFPRVECFGCNNQNAFIEIHMPAFYNDGVVSFDSGSVKIQPDWGFDSGWDGNRRRYYFGNLNDGSWHEFTFEVILPPITISTTVSGQCVNSSCSVSDTRPAAGVPVQLINSFGGVADSGVTNGAGQYTFKQVLTGSYRVDVGLGGNFQYADCSSNGGARTISTSGNVNIRLNNIAGDTPYCHGTISGTVYGRCTDTAACSSSSIGVKPISGGVGVDLVDLNTGAKQSVSANPTFTFNSLGYHKYRLDLNASDLSGKQLQYQYCNSQNTDREVTLSSGTLNKDLFTYDVSPYPGNAAYCGFIPIGFGFPPPPPPPVYGVISPLASIVTTGGDVYSAGGYQLPTYYKDASNNQIMFADYIVFGGEAKPLIFHPEDSASEKKWKGTYQNDLGKYKYAYFWANLEKSIPAGDDAVSPHDDEIKTGDINSRAKVIESIPSGGDMPIVRFVSSSGKIKTKNSINLNGGNKSLVIFIGSTDQKADLVIDDDITVDPTSQLVFIVSGNVTVSKNVGQIDGMYLVDGKFIDLYNLNAGDTVPFKQTLVGSGGIIAWNGFDLGNCGVPGQKCRTSDTAYPPYAAGSAPTYQFNFNPGYLVNLTKVLGEKTHFWSEVAR